MSESNSGLDTFYSEALELIQSLEETLLGIETQGLSSDSINVMFRAVHTIKGSGGLFGLDELVKFVHVVENTLDLARNGSWDFNAERISALLKCADHIKLLVETSINEKEVPAYLIDNGHELLIPLGTLGQIKELSTNTDIVWVDDEPETTAIAETIESSFWHLSVNFGNNIFRDGMDPASFLVFLEKLGKIQRIKTIAPALTWEEFNPEKCYLDSEISFQSTAKKEEIENVFEFIRRDGKIKILPPRAEISAYVQFIEKHEFAGRKIGEILRECGSLTDQELYRILNIQTKEAEINPENVRKIGDIIKDEKITHNEIVDAAVKKQKTVATAVKAVDRQYIKVDSSKLDSLINLVGELVIAGAGAKLLTKDANNLALLESVEHVGHLVEQIRDSSLGLRMVAIDSVFQRFPRVIRDVSKELGKEILLEISGAETELDKSIVEKLTDPLTHIIRNAMDHGLETSEQRVAAGKDPTGKIYLSAFHDSGNVVIEIEDNGKGLDRDRILKKAIEKGIVKEEDQLTDEQIFNLIFEPGFSTAEKVTNLSGRGVGMDVVKQAVLEMRGQVEIESERGGGGVFLIKLTLTHATIYSLRVVFGG
jgi:two-component system chemotaxis sensor kinase CheA